MFTTIILFVLLVLLVVVLLLAHVQAKRLDITQQVNTHLTTELLKLRSQDGVHVDRDGAVQGSPDRPRSPSPADLASLVKGQRDEHVRF